MRGKDFNTGLRGVLFEARHYERMGAAVWLYGWLVLRQTHQSGLVGWVLGGSPITYGEIESETGFNPRTLERWMQILRREGYIETEARPGGIVVRIMKAKKFPQGARRFAGRVREFAGTAPRTCGRFPGYPMEERQLAGGIGSSSVDGLPSEPDTAFFHRDFHKSVKRSESLRDQPVENPALLAPTPAAEATGRIAEPSPTYQQQPRMDLRLIRQLLRAERDEAVRRELSVGSGPEVRRS